MRLPVPDYRVRSVFALTPSTLGRLGIRLLLLDLDNTLVPYGGGAPPESLRAWARELSGAGVELFILSNNRRGHAAKFAGELGIGGVDRAGKPSPRTVLRLLKEKGVLPGQCALAGDQVYTDILCAARAGIRSILVEPVDCSNVFRKMRRGFEAPFLVRRRGFLEDLGL